jgi:hypothetical protein
LVGVIKGREYFISIHNVDSPNCEPTFFRQSFEESAGSGVAITRIRHRRAEWEGREQ